MVTAIFPGSFDPLTKGHLDIISRAKSCFDRLIVAVGYNSSKKAWFSPLERIQMIEEATPGIEVVSFEGLLVDCAAKHGATVIVKGVRDATDLAYETTQAITNRQMSGIETLYLPTSPHTQHISSSLVRELHRWGADLGDYVPAHVASLIKAKS